MRPFSKISPAVWQSERFNNLPSDEGRYLYIYLLTSTHQTSAGAYRLPIGYACADLGWQHSKYETARDQLIAADLIAFDNEASVVMITRWFKHNPPQNPSHLTGIESELSRLPSGAIAERAFQELQDAQDAIAVERQSKLARKAKPHTNASNGHNGPFPERLETPFMARSKQ